MAFSTPIGLLYVPGKLIVPGNATATAGNLRASEGLLRVGIASELFHQIVEVFLVLALYRLFKAVDETLAQQVVILGALVSVPPSESAGTSPAPRRGTSIRGRVGVACQSMCRTGGQRGTNLDEVLEAERPGIGERMRAVIFGSIVLLVATFGTSHAQSSNPTPKVEGAGLSSGNSADTFCVVDSRIDGEFKGWEGETTFRLQNGEVWQQAASGHKYTYVISPKVLIYQSGSEFRMKVEGIDEEIAVRRGGC